MRRLIIAAMFAASVILGFAVHISAAPITCPPPQVATHDAGGPWYCLNPGGNPSGADETKNPND
jgi:hypothetical protein